MRKITTILLLLISIFSFAQTANDLSSYVPYTGKYGYGENPGWYYYVRSDGAWISNWSTSDIINLNMGNASKGVKGIGAKAFRMKLTDDHLTRYGINIEQPSYTTLIQNGSTETTAFVGEPYETHRLDTTFPGASGKSKIFKGLYEPIWLDAAKTKVNPANTFAAYLYQVIRAYPSVKFWEIVNEPDFTYGDGGWQGDTNPPGANSWFFRDPSPSELVNLQAPIQYYIRMLRVAWEVIKQNDPTDYICTGGIGNRSFTAALLRNTDNPDGGRVTPEFPLKAGAWFDCLSFHTYPEFANTMKWYYSCKWMEPNCTSGFRYARNSDNAIKGHLQYKRWHDSLLILAGYDGIKMPKKHFICTETGMSRVMDNDNVGSNEIQRNYMLKCHIKTQVDGQIRQTYWFQTGDGIGTTHWEMFGCHYYFGNKSPYTATPTDQGVAMKTMSDLLYSKSYDSVRTKSLLLPLNVDGATFKGTNGIVIVLWAKTTKDLSEEATATIALPGSWQRKEWNYSATGISRTERDVVTLSGTPSFFEVVTSLPVEDKPKPPRPKPNKKYLKVEIYDSNGWMLLSEKNLTVKEAERVVLNSPYAIGMYYIKFADTEAFTKKISKLK